MKPSVSHSLKLIAISAISAMCLAATEVPRGIVVEVVGTCIVESSAQGKWTTLTRNDQLLPAQRVICTERSRAVLLFPGQTATVLVHGSGSVVGVERPPLPAASQVKPAAVAAPLVVVPAPAAEPASAPMRLQRRELDPANAGGRRADISADKPGNFNFKGNFVPVPGLPVMGSTETGVDPGIAPELATRLAEAKPRASVYSAIGAAAGSLVGAPIGRREGSAVDDRRSLDAGLALPLARATAGATSRSTVKLSTFEGDLYCKRIVAPFEISQDLSSLASLSTISDMQVAKSGIEGTSNTSASGRTAGEAPQNIPFGARSAVLRMNWLPMSAEITYGRMMLAKMKEDLLERDSRVGKIFYPMADALLADVLAGVTEPHPYTFEVVIRPGHGANAVGLPGGFIVIDSVLLTDNKLRNKAKFAIAHEISRALQRFETRSLQARIIDTVLQKGSFQELIKAIRSMQEDPRPIFEVMLSSKVKFPQYPAQWVLTTDSCAVRVLDQALQDNVKLAGVLQSVVADLATTTEPIEERGRLAMRFLNAPESSRTSGDVDRADRLINEVERPTDRNPASRERINNLKRALDELTVRVRQSAPVGKPGSKPTQSPASPAVVN